MAMAKPRRMPRAIIHSDGGAQPDREEQRDHDEDDDAAGLDHGLHEEVRDEDPERAEEADHERRVAADRSPEPAELRVLVGVRADLALDRLGLGLGLLGPLGVLASAAASLATAPRASARGLGARPPPAARSARSAAVPWPAPPGAVTPSAWPGRTSPA